MLVGTTFKIGERFKYVFNIAIGRSFLKLFINEANLPIFYE